MSDPILGLTMLGLIVVAIMMGFPTAFTLMGLGMIFGALAFWDPSQHWWQNRIFDLMVQRTYGVMVNDTLLSVPLFVFMGYVMERAALVDRMFHSVQLAFRRVPASLAVTTLLVCAFWGIASGIVGAVVVLMGVIAMRPMLNAGYDVRLAAGAITAGGTLGILIPPSVMLIVYAAVAGQSIVKLYAAAMLPGFFLTFLYLVYILGWAIINPRIAPKLPPDQYRLNVPDWLQRLEHGPSKRVFGNLITLLVRPGLLRDAKTADGKPLGYGHIVNNVVALMVPLALTLGIFTGTWWYVVIHNAPAAAAVAKSQTAPEVRSPAQRHQRRWRNRKSLAAQPISRKNRLASKSRQRNWARRKPRCNRPNRPLRRTLRRKKWAVLQSRRPPQPRARCRKIFTPGFGVSLCFRRSCWRCITGAWTANSSKSSKNCPFQWFPWACSRSSCWP